MPNTKSAKKKLRKDIKRTEWNKQYKNKVEFMMKKLKKEKDSAKIDELVKKLYSIIDKAAKKNVFHKNKASRLKSNISKLVKSKK